MKKFLSWLSILLVMAFLLATFTGCATEFSHSNGLDDKGFFKRVNALDHVELSEYSGITVPEEIHKIPDETVQAEIDAILAGYTSEKQVTDRAIADGDTVNIDYVGSVDGVEFEDGSTGGQGADVTIGVTQYIDDFLEQLIGHTPGESFDIEVTFPEEYGVEELNGKDAVFAITVNYIVETITPELTDDFVVENLSGQYGWNTAEEMEEEIKGDMQSVAVSGYVQDYIVENTTVESVPDSMLTYQKNSTLDIYQDYADYYEMDLDQFLIEYMDGATTEELLEEHYEDNMEMATLFLIIQAIAEDADISVTDDDVAAFFADEMGMEDYTEYETDYGMPYLKLIVLQQKVLEYLADNAVLE